MADPEIELPKSPSQLNIHGLSPGINRSDISSGDAWRSEEKQCTAGNSDDEKPPGDLEDQNDLEPEEIIFHYLTFQTNLPGPTTIYPTSEDQELPPAPPDLTKYVSPFEWSNTRKRVIIWVSCVITALTAFTAGSYSPGVGQMTEEWHVSSVAALVGITTFTTGITECHHIRIWPLG